MKKWNLNSWKNYPAKHLPVYQNKDELDLVLDKIKKYPPLVFAGESRSLKKSLAKVVKGESFLLQGGDCAESFAEFHPDNICLLYTSPSPRDSSKSRMPSSA